MYPLDYNKLLSNISSYKEFVGATNPSSEIAKTMYNDLIEEETIKRHDDAYLNELLGYFYGGHTIPGLKAIFYPGKEVNQSSIIHERTHAANARKLEYLIKRRKLQLKNENTSDNYLDNTGEIYARRNEFLFDINANPKKIWTKEDLDNYREKLVEYDLDRYTDDDILFLLNNIAKNSVNNTNNINNLQYAKFGGNTNTNSPVKGINNKNMKRIKKAKNGIIQENDNTSVYVKPVINPIAVPTWDELEENRKKWYNTKLNLKNSTHDEREEATYDNTIREIVKSNENDSVANYVIRLMQKSPTFQENWHNIITAFNPNNKKEYYDNIVNLYNDTYDYVNKKAMGGKTKNDIINGNLYRFFPSTGQQEFAKGGRIKAEYGLSEEEKKDVEEGYKVLNRNHWLTTGLSAGINGLAGITGSIINNITNRKYLSNMEDLVKNMKAYTAPIYKLKTNYDINPQLASIDNELGFYNRMIGANSSSSNNALNRLRAGRQAGIISKNEQYGIKQNKENELINADILNQQAQMQKIVENAQNVYNTKQQLLQEIMDKRGENATSTISNITGSVSAASEALLNGVNNYETLLAGLAASPNGTYPTVGHIGRVSRLKKKS